MMTSEAPTSPRSPMKQLTRQDNIPNASQKKSVQLGIEAFTKKRELDLDGNPNPRIKKVKTNGVDSPGSTNILSVPSTICHQCRQHVYKIRSVQCTRLKKAGSAKTPSTKRCVVAYCSRCLYNRYNEPMGDIFKQPQICEGHVHDVGYTWSCPSCRGICNCSVCRKKSGQAPLGTLGKSSSTETKEKSASEKTKVERQKEQIPSDHGIQSFFQKVDSNDDRRRTSEASKNSGFPDDADVSRRVVLIPVIAKGSAPRRAKPKIPALKVVEPPQFQPVRATTTDAGFLDRLKVREFVLKFEKIFSRKLQVPAKHIKQMADPCDTPPSLTIKHLYAALLKIIQSDLTSKDDQERMKETLKRVEKSVSGSENVLAATVEWLNEMDAKHPVSEDDEIVVACKLIDWAVGTTVCREEIDANVEKLKTLKSDNLAAVKTMKTEYEEKKAELHKERLRIVEKDLVEQWKSSVSELDNEYKSEMTTLSTELWTESRRLSPRTTPLGTDLLGNKYWVFSSRKVKQREFGGYVVIQTPEGKTSPSEITSSAGFEVNDDPFAPAVSTEPDSEDSYIALKNWYYVDKAEDIMQLRSWTTYLALKAAAEQERRERKQSFKGSPNKSGQLFAVEIPSPRFKERPGKGRKVVELVGTVDTKMLCDELLHAAEWIEEKWPYEEEIEDEAEEVVIDGEVIVLDP